MRDEINARLGRNGLMDFLAANRLGQDIYTDLINSPAGPPNNARFTFQDPSATRFYLDWERAASDIVTILRAEARQQPL